MQKARKLLIVTLVNIALITLILYGFEFFFSPYANLPANGFIRGELYTWGHLVTNNKHGFRERSFEIPKPPGLYRVMVLGDSLTWGAGLTPEERYTAIAGKLLNNAFDDREFEVLNFGISGGPTTLERDLLLHISNAVNPDLIVVGFCLNDPQPKGQNYSIEREKLRASKVGRIINQLSDTMHTAGLPYVGKLLNKIFYLLAEKRGLIPTWQQALNRTYKPQSREWREFTHALEDIKMASDELSLPPPIFSILNQGTYNDKPTSYVAPDENLKQFLHWYHQAEKAAKKIGFSSYNHEYEIAHNLENESLAINIVDGHPSANLNRIYGEKLYREIVSQLGSTNK